MKIKYEALASVQNIYKSVEEEKTYWALQVTNPNPNPNYHVIG